MMRFKYAPLTVPDDEGANVASLVAGILAGMDCIDDPSVAGRSGTITTATSTRPAT